MANAYIKSLKGLCHSEFSDASMASAIQLMTRVIFNFNSKNGSDLIIVFYVFTRKFSKIFFF